MVPRVGNLIKTHIAKAADNPTYAAKALLMSAVGLDCYSHMVDYVQIGRNKEIKKEEKQYLQAFHLSTTFVSAAAQTAVGLAVINEKTQDFLAKKLFNNDINRSSLMKWSSLLVAVVLTKRILVPLIVTPLASIVKKRENRNIFECEKGYDYGQEKRLSGRR